MTASAAMVDTTRIIAFRHPSQAELLLESLLVGLRRLPRKVRKLTCRSELPSALQRIAMRSSRRKAAWSAWVDGETIWFFTAELASVPFNGRPTPALAVSGYDRKGVLTECGTWVNVPKRGWRRCAL